MKSYNHLYNQICSFENLLLASRKAQRGKRFKEYTGKFNFNLENELITLQQELIDKTYQPGAYTEFYIYDAKKRKISAAPYRDRVVHHALCNLIEPIFDKSMIYDTYANRQGKGTHSAILRFQSFSRKNSYAFKGDIKKYFPCIDHKILLETLFDRIQCKDTRWLIKIIIDNSNPQEEVLDYFNGDDLLTPIMRRKGLPLGNLTSQFFANIYLNGFDHFIKEGLQCKYYIRYVDDFVLFSNNKRELKSLKNELIDYLETIRLKINSKRSQIIPTEKGVSLKATGLCVAVHGTTIPTIAEQLIVIGTTQRIRTTT